MGGSFFVPLWGVRRVLKSWVMSGFAEDFQVGWVKMKCFREDENYCENRVFWRKFWDQFGTTFYMVPEKFISLV